MQKTYIQITDFYSLNPIVTVKIDLLYEWVVNTYVSPIVSMESL